MMIPETIEKKTVKTDLSVTVHDKITRLKRFFAYVENKDLTLSEIIDEAISEWASSNPAIADVLKGDAA